MNVDRGLRDDPEKDRVNRPTAQPDPPSTRRGENSYNWLVELVQARLEDQELTGEDLAYIHLQWERFETDAVQALADDIALTLERF